MTKQTQSLSIKIVGILSILYSIPFLRSIADAFAIKYSHFFENKTEQSQLFLYSLGSAVTPVIILTAIGIFLIINGDKISDFLAKNSIEKEEKTDIKSIQSVAFSIIGVVLIVFSIPEIIQTILYYIFISEAGDQIPVKAVPISSWANLVAQTIQFIIGITLFLGSKGLTSLWYFLQKVRPMSKINMNT